MSDKQPVLIEIADDEVQADPVSAPPVPDEILEGRAMTTAIAFGGRRPSRLAMWFWRVAIALLTFGLSLWAWDSLTSLISRNLYLGYAALGLTTVLIVILLAMAIKEIAAFARMRRIGQFRTRFENLRDQGEIDAASRFVGDLQRLYRNRPELDWAQSRLNEHRVDAFDVDTLMQLTEAELMGPLDTMAVEKIETASRQVATATALVPLALADVVVALTANLRMIRQIAEIYGGHSGTLGSWQLAKNVMAHLVATGAIAIGDDLIGSVAGGGLVSKLSRRFGEGVVNGALTARVGVAAMEVCRPIPFEAIPRPKVSALVAHALTGLFGKNVKS